MATSIEAQGHTVDEAIQIALNQLGVSRDKVEIDILHHPRRGLLGIGARRAKVRATIRESVMLDGEEFDMSGGADLEDKPRRRRRRGGRNRAGSRDGERSEAPQTAVPRPAAVPGRDAGRTEGERRGDSRRAAGEGDAGRGRGDGRSRDDRRGGRGRGDQRGPGEGRAGQPRDGARTEGARTEGGRQEGGRQEGGRQEGGRQEGGRQEGGRQEGGRQEGGRQEGGRPEGGRPEGGRPEGGRQEGGRQERGDRSQRGRQRDQGDQQGRGRGRTDTPAQAVQPSTESSSEAAGGHGSAQASRMSQVIPSRRGSASEEPALDAETLEAIRARADELVRELLAKMGFAAEVTSSVDEAAGEAVVSVRSENEGLLIGRRGQTLDSLEHIVNRMTLRAESYVEGRVLLDIGDYRRRRRESLEELATRLRTRAVGERRTVQVSPMSPRDRRFFAQAFADDETVEVRALGAGFYRRVIVAPAGTGSASVTDAEPIGDSDDEAVDQGFAGAEADN